MTRRRSVSSAVVIFAAAAAAVLLMVMFAVQEYRKDVLVHIFYNDTAPDEHPFHNSGNVLDEKFASAALATAPAEVRADPPAHVEWFKMDLFNRIYDQTNNTGDPVLLAQLALDARLRAPKTVSEKLLPSEEQSTEMWETTVLRFVGDSGAHIETAGRLQAVWNRAERVTVQQITGGYTSMGYQERDGIKLDVEYAEKLGREAIPMPVLKNTQGVKGWEITFHFANGEKLSYRIDCGYQPDSTSYGGKTPVEKPKSTPEPTKRSSNPTPTPKPGPDISVDVTDPTPKPNPDISVNIIDPTPTPKPTPRPTPRPEPTTTPAPKDPDAGPQGQNPNNPDYGGGPNTNNDTQLKPEPNSPATYTPPERPTPPPDQDSTEPADNGRGIVDNYQPDPNTGQGGATETIVVDTDGDGRNDDVFTGEVVVGDVPEQPLDEVHANPPSVEPELNDGENVMDLLPPQ